VSLSEAVVRRRFDDGAAELGALALLGALPATALAALGARLFEEPPLSLVSDLVHGRSVRGLVDGWPGWARWSRADPNRVGAWCRHHGLSVVLSPSADRSAGTSDEGLGHLGTSATGPDGLGARVAPWLVLARQGMPGPEGAEGTCVPERAEAAGTDLERAAARAGRARRPRVLPVERIPVVGIVSGRGATCYGRQVGALLGEEAARAGARVLAPLQGAGLPALQRAAALAERGGALSPWAVSADPLLGTRWSPARERLVERVLRLADGAVIGNRAVGLDVALTGTPSDPVGSALWQAEAGRTVGIGADVLVVVEWDGAERSGPVGAAVDAALAGGAEVAAVPGSVFSTASAGCNRLLSEGATVIADVGELRVVLERALSGRW